MKHFTDKQWWINFGTSFSEPGRKTWFCLLSVIFLIFVFVSFNTLDPDFGWHYQMGSYISTNRQVPEVDPFSHTMSSFHFVDHEWLTNIFMFGFYNTFGYLGLAIFYSFLIVLTIGLVVRRRHQGVIFVVFLVTAVLLPRSGVRPQVETWALLAFLLAVLKSSLWKKLVFFSPLFFCFWANLHGGFGVGLVVYFLYLIGNYFQYKVLHLHEVFFFGLSVVATLINPYGIRLWYEVWMQLSDSFLRLSIQEWRPFYTYFEIQVFVVFIISLVFAWKRRFEFGIWKFLVLFLFFVMSLSSIRHAALLMVWGLVFIPEILNIFKLKSVLEKVAVFRFRIFVCLLTVFSLLLFLLALLDQFSRIAAGGLNQSVWYPVGGVEYIKLNPAKGRLFNEYGWGGYIIWKLPEEKVFIDGRMPSWRESDLVSLSGLWSKLSVEKWFPGIGESEYVFKDYIKIVDDRELGLLEKYSVGTVLWPKDRENLSFDSFIEKFFMALFSVKDQRQTTTFVEDLLKSGWKIVYEDRLCVVLRK